MNHLSGFWGMDVLNRGRDMTVIDEALKVTKKTHIKRIKRWFKRGEFKHRYCPFKSIKYDKIIDCPKASRFGNPKAHPVCRALFPRIDRYEEKTMEPCPCGEYRHKYVAHRAKQLVKAWEEQNA
jgi:hypothetical protein